MNENNIESLQIHTHAGLPPISGPVGLQAVWYNALMVHTNG